LLLSSKTILGYGRCSETKNEILIVASYETYVILYACI